MVQSRIKTALRTNPASKTPRVKPPPPAPEEPPGDSAPSRRPGRHSPAGGAAAAVQVLSFFALFYGCLWKWVDVSLIYHGGGVIRDFPVFFWGADFFREFLSYPGGVAEYFSALLAQSLFHSWLGALVLALQAWVSVACASAFLRALDADWLRPVIFVPPLLLLALYSGYAHFSAPVTALSAALVFLWLYLRLRSLNSWVRLGALLCLSALLYGIAGGALLVFSLLVAAVELHSGGRWPMFLASLLAGIVAPLAVGLSFFHLSLAEVWHGLLPISWDATLPAPRGVWLLIAWYAVLPAAAFGVLLGRGDCRQWFQRAARGRAAQSARPSSPGKGATRPAPSAARAARAAEPLARLRAFLQPANRATWLAQTVFLLLATLGILAGAHDRKFESLLAVDYYAWHKMWPQVLEAATVNPKDIYVRSAVAQALFHTGRLGRELPVLDKPGDLLLFDEQQPGEWKKSDLYFDLGYVNMALHHLSEAVSLCGERPMLLQRLALVNLALGNGSTARIYLNALTRVPFYSRWAKDYLQRLESDPALAGDQEVSRLRTQKMNRDTILRLPVDRVLLMLLNADRQNRMAFEYLMTYFLLTRNLAGFLDNLSRADDFAGFDIPPLWDDALALATKPLGRHPNLRTHPASAEARRRLEHVAQVIAGCSGNREMARGKLQNEHDYGTSYFLYYLFHS